MSHSQSSNKLVEAYVLIAIAILCMIGFNYRTTGKANLPADRPVVQEVGDNAAVESEAIVTLYNAKAKH